MSTVPTYLSCIVNDGKLAIAEALIQGKKITPHSFIIGDTYNFTPTDDGTVVAGNVVYVGTRGLITGSILSKDQFRFNLVVPESAGPFTVGNIMFYVQSDDGTVFPFIWVAMKIPYPKAGQAPGSIGNRFVFELIEKIVNVTDVLDIEIQPSEYFSLAGFTSELELPTPSEALFQQFVVHEPRYSPVPFVGMRRGVDNTYWGMPLPFRVGDPFFGILDGGRAGEPKYPSQSRMFWGGRLRMQPSDLMVNYGGGNLTDKPVYSIGGEPLPANPGYTPYP
jgi:hypothetical protein